MLRINFKQGPEESLSEAMQRYKDTVRVPMLNLGMPAQPPGDEANAFIMSLLPSYEQMRQRLKQNAVKLKKIPGENHAYPAALLLYGPPENIEEAYELALAEGVAVTLKAAFITIETDDKKGGKRGDNKKGERPKRSFDKPPTTGCRFCGGMQCERFCEAREEASKAYREKHGIPPHVPPADSEDSKRPPKKI